MRTAWFQVTVHDDRPFREQFAAVAKVVRAAGNDAHVAACADGTERIAVFVRRGREDDTEHDDIRRCLARLPVRTSFETLDREDVGDDCWDRLVGDQWAKIVEGSAY